MPTLPMPTLPLDRVHHARALCRELETVLASLSLSHASQSAADLIEGARASNAATRTLLRHGTLPLEQAGLERCRIGPDGQAELCDGCGMYLSLCVCSY
jgi:hypothetical protein